MDRRAALPLQVRAQNCHQDRMLELLWPRIARQGQLEGHRLWQRDAVDRLQQHAAHAPGRCHQRKEGPARERRFESFAQRGAVDRGLGGHALVQRRRQTVRDQPVV